MEYRNGGNATHFSKGMAFGVEGSTGVEIQGSTIQAIGDTTSHNLTVRAKGTGTLQLGDSSNSVFVSGSTTPFKLVSGKSTYSPPDLPANGQGECTFAAAGLSTGDLIICVDFRNTMSTKYLPGYAYVGEAGKIHVPVGNVHASTISGTAKSTVTWAYLDRT